MTDKEWESFKSYVNHKFKMNGKIENTELSIKTLETFFLKVKKNKLNYTSEVETNNCNSQINFGGKK